MSDSAGTKYGLPQTGGNSFSDQDHSPNPPVANNPNPVTLNISGSVENVSLVTTRETVMNVGGNVVNSSFSGQNLHAGDKTIINVTGSNIFNSPLFDQASFPSP